MRRMRLHAWIPGRPVPQGSKAAMLPRNMKRPVLVDSNADRLKPWRAQVTTSTMDAWGGQAALDEAVIVSLEFVFARPRAHYGTGKNHASLKPSAPAWPTGRGQGDVDKLARAVLDGLTDASVLVDDSRVASLHARKVWGPKEGCHVWIETMEDDRG